MDVRLAVLIGSLVLISCEDESLKREQSEDLNRISDVTSIDYGPEVSYIDRSPPRDALKQDAAPQVNSCEEVTVDNYQAYCTCFPQCCSRQEWFCPPTPDNSIQSMLVVVEVCNESEEQCEFGTDPQCPPPEIIYQSPCEVAHECPPGTSREFLRWFECQLPDGRQGQQRVLCDKGEIMHGPCIACEPELCDNQDNDCDSRVDEDPVVCEGPCGPGIGICREGVVTDCISPNQGEEVCDLVDNDCDGTVDEGQENACGQCGPLPNEVCDGEDNDCDGNTDEDLVRECETLCERGIETCIGGRWNSCSARAPIEEICDGFDNDCNGFIDDGLDCLCTVDQVGVLFPCAEPPLICGSGFKTCQCIDVDCTEMEMTPCLAACVFFEPPPNVECHPGMGQALEIETCNAFDEDCDEMNDEGLTRDCYTGEPETLGVGICTDGVQYCSEGRWGADDDNINFVEDLCGGEIIPSREICNGADDDCDGEVDYGEEVADTDILLIVDVSGSMREEIQAVFVALSRFAQHFDAEDAIHWGLVIGPTDVMLNGGGHREMLRIVSNISPFEDFLARFAAVDYDPGGQEMLRDAVYLSLRNLSGEVDLAGRDWVQGIGSEPRLNEFVINWRPGTDRIIIVFSDEASQSFLEPPVDRDDLRTALTNASKTVLHTFAPKFYDWDERALETGGMDFFLTRDPVTMYNDLMTIIDQACLPREEEEEINQVEQLGGLRSLGYNFVNQYFTVNHYPYDYNLGLCIPQVE